MNNRHDPLSAYQERSQQAQQKQREQQESQQQQQLPPSGRPNEQRRPMPIPEWAMSKEEQEARKKKRIADQTAKGYRPPNFLPDSEHERAVAAREEQQREDRSVAPQKTKVYKLFGREIETSIWPNPSNRTLQNYALSGLGAGFISTAATYPADRTILFFQQHALAKQTNRIKGTSSASKRYFKTIFSSKGIKFLTHGMLGGALKNGLFFAALFPLYEMSKDKIAKTQWIHRLNPNIYPALFGFTTAGIASMYLVIHDIAFNFWGLELPWRMKTAIRYLAFPTIFAAGLRWGSTFGIYERMKAKDIDPATSGVIATIVATTLHLPFESLKSVRLLNLLPQNWKRAEKISTMRGLVRHFGFKHLWTGYWRLLLKNILSTVSVLLLLEFFSCGIMNPLAPKESLKIIQSFETSLLQGVNPNEIPEEIRKKYPNIEEKLDSRPE